MQGNAVTQGFAIEVPQKAQEGEFFVFFAADVISGEVKSNNPLWTMGGALRPKMKSLMYRNGYIRKCEITQLRPQMISEAIHNIQPNERKHLRPTYAIREGAQVAQIGITKDGRHDGLLRTEWHPASEVGTFTSKIDGLVRMPAANAAEAIAAQYFLFPDWDLITAGAVQLSRRISDLVDHFQERLRAAETDQQRAVATAALKSCTDYQTWGRRITSEANAMYERMKTKGEAWPIGSDATGAFDQLGLQRQDSLVQDQGNQLATLTNVMTKLVEIQTQKETPAMPNLDADYAEFLAWRAQRDAPVTAKEFQPDPRKEVETPQPHPTFVKDAVINVDGRIAKMYAPMFNWGVKARYLDDNTEVTVRNVDVVLVESGE